MSFVTSCMTPLLLFVLLVSLEAKASSPAEKASSPAEKAADPSVNEKFLDPKLDVEHWAKNFEGESREVFKHRKRIVKLVAPKRGQTVADIGAGTGLFTFLFADAVGRKGKVFAVEVSPQFLRHIEARARERGLPQVATVEGAQASPNLPAAAIDRVFICDTYHHFEKPLPMLAAIKQALKPGGEVVVVDFKREADSSDWVKQHVRASKEQVIEEFSSQGFSVAREASFLKDNYILVFKPTS